MEIEGPEEIASARLYAGPSGLRNDGDEDPWLFTEEGPVTPSTCVIEEDMWLRKAKRLRDVFAGSASGISTCSAGTTRWITSAAI